MAQYNNIRYHPFFCMLLTIGNLVRGRLHFSRTHHGKMLKMDDGQQFTIFRHMILDKSASDLEATPVVFIVRFKFAALSQRANRVVSLVPIPLIAGFPGFREKIWMVNEHTGDWQGVYQWESEQAVEAYQHSFVLGVMNKRAVQESLSYTILPNTCLADYIRTHITTQGT